MADSPLFDDGIMSAGKSGPGKKVVDVAQPAMLAVKQILAFA